MRVEVSGCSVPWESMTGGAVRYCAQCRQQVTDLSAMTEREARRFLARHGDSRCVSYETEEVDGDEIMRFAPRPPLVQLRAPARRAGGAAVMAASLSLAACQTSAPEAEGRAASLDAAPSASAETTPPSSSIVDAIPTPSASAEPAPSASSVATEERCDDPTHREADPPVRKTAGTTLPKPRIKRHGGKPVRRDPLVF